MTTPRRSASAASCRASSRSSINGSANFGAFQPGVTRDYSASAVGHATSSATAAELTVRDPSTPRRATWSTARTRWRSPCRSAPRTRPTRARRTRRCPRTGHALRLLSFPTPFSGRPLTIGFKQSINADRAARHRRLRQGPGVHALGDDAVSRGCPSRFPPNPPGAWPLLGFGPPAVRARRPGPRARRPAPSASARAARAAGARAAAAACGR